MAFLSDSKKATTSLTHSRIYPLLQRIPDHKWFTMWDLICRCATVVIMFYYLLITNPIKVRYAPKIYTFIFIHVQGFEKIIKMTNFPADDQIHMDVQ